MNFRPITRWIMLSVIAALIVWDVLAYLIGGNNSTISVIITDWSYYSPWIPYLFGLMCGHFFFPAKRSID